MTEKKSSSSFEKHYTETEVRCGNGGNRIYGHLFLPDRKDGEKVPLVLFCHELYRTFASGIPYAERLASEGIAVYTFDFRGASKDSRSPGSMLSMSVMTCMKDLMEVYREALAWDFTDPARVAVIGASQGAFSAAVAASLHPDAFRRIVLLYGAFIIMDDVKTLFPERELVPDPFDYNGWSLLGACYLTDLWDFKIESLAAYKGPVLMLHGDEDPFVPSSYSEEIAGFYENCEYHLIKGGRHGFRKAALEEAAGYLIPFLKEL